MADHVGLVIKKLREERKLSKSRLSREAGISDAYVVQIEQGQRSPSEDVLRRIAHVLRVPPHKLLIPAGFFDADEIARAEASLADMASRCEAAGMPLDADNEDRVFARALGMADDFSAFDPRERDQSDYQRPENISSEQFWGWDKPLAIPPLEHWDTLSPSDRLLLQRMANRLAKAEDPEDQ